MTGRPRSANRDHTSRCFRHALRANPHDLHAMLNALELLRALERHRGCAALLAAAPPSLLREHPELRDYAISVPREPS